MNIKYNHDISNVHTLIFTLFIGLGNSNTNLFLGKSNWIIN